MVGVGVGMGGVGVRAVGIGDRESWLMVRHARVVLLQVLPFLQCDYCEYAAHASDAILLDGDMSLMMTIPSRARLSPSYSQQHHLRLRPVPTPISTSTSISISVLASTSGLAQRISFLLSHQY